MGRVKPPRMTDRVREDQMKIEPFAREGKKETLDKLL